MLQKLLPNGVAFDDALWSRRHEFMVKLLWLHVPILAALGLFGGQAVHTVWEAAIPAVFAWAGTRPFSRSIRATMVSSGLLVAAALLVHVTGGMIEAHFHFFILLPVVAMYLDWRPLAAAVGFVVVHHLTMAFVSPELVFNPSVEMHPVVRTLIHAVFVIVEVVLLGYRWKFDQDVIDEQRKAEAGMREAEEQARIEAERSAELARHALEESTELEREQREAARIAKLDAEETRRRLEILATTQRDLSEIGIRLAEASEQSTAQIDRIATGAGSLASAARDASDVAGVASSNASSGEEIVKTAAADVVLAMERITDATRGAQTLRDHAREIDKIVTLIGSIADQTNLLALNAAIEAARAGEHGRGFAVVAGEVKSLAESTNESLHGVSELVRATDATVNELVTILGDVERAVSSSTERSGEARDQFASITQALGSVTEMASTMAAAAGGFAEAADTLKISSHTVSELADETAALALQSL